jgi:hypothetical protein
VRGHVAQQAAAVAMAIWQPVVHHSMVKQLTSVAEE